MKKAEFTVTKQNNLDVVRYELKAADVYDERVADKISQANGIVTFQYSDDDGTRSITSYVKDGNSLESMLKKTLDKKVVLAIISGIAGAFEVGALGVPVSYIVKDTNYIYVNEENYTVKCLLLPIKQDVMPMSELPKLFREVLSKLRYDEKDKDNYVAKLITLVNSDDFSVSKLKDLADKELEQIGYYVSKDSGLTDMNAGKAPMNNNSVKVNKLGVMNNMMGQPPQGMPGQPGPMGMPPQGMMGVRPPMPGTPQAMMGQPQMGQPRPMGMPGQPPQIGQPPQMGQPRPQGMPGQPPQMGQPAPMGMPGQPPMGQPRPQGMPGQPPQMGQPTPIGMPGQPAPMGQPRPQGMPGQPPMGQPAPMGMPGQPPMGQPAPMGMPGQPPMGQPAPMGMPGQPPKPAAPAPQGMPMPGMMPAASAPAPAPEPAKEPEPVIEDKKEEEASPFEEIKTEEPKVEEPKVEEPKQEPPKPVMPTAPTPVMPAAPTPVMPTAPTPVMPTAPTPVMPNSTPTPNPAPAEFTMGSITGQLGSKPVPHIVRKNTGEAINITKPEFTIGKSKTKADYVIENNSAISRVHCIIVQKDGVNYIKDNNSTNHTYVNGVELEPGKEVLLKNKTVIQLGDEEFTFLLRKGE